MELLEFLGFLGVEYILGLECMYLGNLTVF